jgi:hypothetical protein
MHSIEATEYDLCYLIKSSLNRKVEEEDEEEE